MNKLNIGIIGCGRISDLHYPGYKNHPRARIYAVCDPVEQRTREKLKEWGAEKYYSDYRELLADKTLDAVEILTPHHLHKEMVVEAARAGLHIALQKPMTIDLKNADRMLEAVKASNKVFKVTDNYVFYPPIAKAKSLIEAGEIGTPLNLRIKLLSGGKGGWDVPPEAWAWRMQEMEAGRGMQTFDHGHHLWATAWFLMGEVERVVSWIDSVDGVIDSPAAIMWKYKNGPQYGMCEYAHASDMNIPSKYYANDEWMEITGSKGIILINRCTGQVLPSPVLSIFKGEKWEHITDIESDWSEGFRLAAHNFISAVDGNEDPLLTGDQAREILKMSLAISRSSQLRREVYTDEMDKSRPHFYSWNRRRREKKARLNKKSLLSRLWPGSKDDKYAPQAEELTDSIIGRFNPEAAAGWNAAIGLKITSETEAQNLVYSLIVRDGKATLEKDSLPDNADLVLRVPAGTWAAVLLGKKRIETAFLQGKLKIEGKAEQGLKLREVFGI